MLKIFEKFKKKEKEVVEMQLGLEVRFPGCENFVPLGKDQYKRIYLDSLGPRAIMVLDECGELFQPSGVKTQEGKEEDELKTELIGLIQSITQMGRSSGMHVILCTQRNDANLIPGIIQNNPLSVKTKMRVRREAVN